MTLMTLHALSHFAPLKIPKFEFPRQIGACVRQLFERVAYMVRARGVLEAEGRLMCEGVKQQGKVHTAIDHGG